MPHLDWRMYLLLPQPSSLHLRRMLPKLATTHLQTGFTFSHCLGSPLEGSCHHLHASPQFWETKQRSQARPRPSCRLRKSRFCVHRWHCLSLRHQRTGRLSLSNLQRRRHRCKRQSWASMHRSRGTCRPLNSSTHMCECRTRRLLCSHRASAQCCLHRSWLHPYRRQPYAHKFQLQHQDCRNRPVCCHHHLRHPSWARTWGCLPSHHRLLLHRFLVRTWIGHQPRHHQRMHPHCTWWTCCQRPSLALQPCPQSALRLTAWGRAGHAPSCTQRVAPMVLSAHIVTCACRERRSDG